MDSRTEEVFLSIVPATLGTIGSAGGVSQARNSPTNSRLQKAFGETTQALRLTGVEQPLERIGRGLTAIFGSVALLCGHELAAK
jgi:hypothetical protein